MAQYATMLRAVPTPPGQAYESLLRVLSDCGRAGLSRFKRKTGVASNG